MSMTQANNKIKILETQVDATGLVMQCVHVFDDALPNGQVLTHHFEYPLAKIKAIWIEASPSFAFESSETWFARLDGWHVQQAPLGTATSASWSLSGQLRLDSLAIDLGGDGGIDSSLMHTTIKQMVMSAGAGWSALS